MRSEMPQRFSCRQSTMNEFFTSRDGQAVGIGALEQLSQLLTNDFAQRLER